MLAVNGVGKPCAGEPHARIDGRELETELKLTTATEKNHLGRNPGATTAPAPTVGPSHRASSRPSNLAARAIGTLPGGLTGELVWRLPQVMEVRPDVTG